MSFTFLKHKNYVLFENLFSYIQKKLYVHYKKKV